MIRQLSAFSLFLAGPLLVAPATGQSAPRESAPMQSAPGEAATHGIESEALEPPCDRVCTLQQKNAALEKYIKSLKSSLAARDAYIDALKKEVARLKAGSQ